MYTQKQSEMNIMSSEVAYLNNRGLHDLHAGAYTSAIKQLSASLTLVKENLTTQLVDSADVSLDEYITAPLRSRPATTSGEQEKLIRQGMCCRAVQLPEAGPVSPSASVGIIFNIALANQLLALETYSCGPTRDAILDKAAYLYKLANELQQEQNLAVEKNALFTLATINNLALIYKSKGDMDVANKLYQQMLTISVYLIDWNRGGTAATAITTFVQQQQQHSSTSPSTGLDWFFHNAFDALALIECRSAPAA